MGGQAWLISLADKCVGGRKKNFDPSLKCSTSACLRDELLVINYYNYYYTRLTASFPGQPR